MALYTGSSPVAIATSASHNKRSILTRIGGLSFPSDFESCIVVE